MLAYAKNKLIKKANKALRFAISFFDADFLRTIHKETALKLALNSLSKNAHVSIQTVYDVGAHTGSWSKALKKKFPKMDFYLFEANSGQTKNLEKLPFRFFTEVLSSEVKNVNFYSHGEGGTGDSYFKEDTTFYLSTQATEVVTNTLDEVVKKNQLPQVDLLKIDTQGSEIDILNGAQACLPNAKLVYLEVPIYPYNQGAPPLNDYITYMKSKDFIAIDCCELHVSSSVLMQIDLLFMRRDLLEKTNPKVFKEYLFLA